MKKPQDDVSITFNKEFKLEGSHTLKDFLVFKKGMQPYEEGKGNPPQTREMMEGKVYHSNIRIDDSFLPMVGAKHIKRHLLLPHEEYIKYGNNLAAPRNPDIFKGDRILMNRILSKDKIDAVLVNQDIINNTDVFNLLPINTKEISLKVLYAIVVSRLCATYFKNNNINLNRNAFPKVNVNTLESFPIPNITKETQQEIEELIDKIIDASKYLFIKKSKFLSLLQDNFSQIRITKNLESFYVYDFKLFLEELKKQKISIPLSEQSNWKDFFDDTKKELISVSNLINEKDEKIESIILNLYNLNFKL